MSLLILLLLVLLVLGVASLDPELAFFGVLIGGFAYLIFKVF